LTTIAWDGKSLAVDSRTTCGGNVMTDNTVKLHKNVGRFLAVAFSGDHAPMSDFLEWIKGGEKGDAPKGDVNIVAIGKNKKAYALWREQSSKFINIDAPYTDGTGHQIAQGAMDAGATAVEAVKISIKRDVYTGGKVRSYTHKG
jgi:20S proteasome alpha/beta subunit